jgi:hypothetical protein
MFKHLRFLLIKRNAINRITAWRKNGPPLASARVQCPASWLSPPDRVLLVLVSENLIHTVTAKINNLLAASVAFGVAAGTFCNWATQIKFIFGWDDTLDVRLNFHVVSIFF